MILEMMVVVLVYYFFFYFDLDDIFVVVEYCIGCFQMLGFGSFFKFSLVVLGGVWFGGMSIILIWVYYEQSGYGLDLLQQNELIFFCMGYQWGSDFVSFV